MCMVRGTIKWQKSLAVDPVAQCANLLISAYKTIDPHNTPRFMQSVGYSLHRLSGPTLEPARGHARQEVCGAGPPG